MRKITINLAAREKKPSSAPVAAAGALIFAALFTWHNVDRYLGNRSQMGILKERAAALEKALPEGLRKGGPAVRIDQKALLEDIEFVNDYAYRKSFSWTALLSQLEEGLPNDVHLVQISPEFKSGKVNVTGFTRSMDSALAAVDRLGRAGFHDVFLLKHSRDEKTGLILFDISAVYRPSYL